MMTSDFPNYDADGSVGEYEDAVRASVTLIFLPVLLYVHRDRPER